MKKWYSYIKGALKMKKILKKLLDVYIEFWKKGLDFNGEETRKNYWLTELCHLIIFYCIFLLSMYLIAGKIIHNAIKFFQYGEELYFLACMIPKLAQQTRRLNSLKLSKWILLINFLFIFGWPILAIIYLLPTPKETVIDGIANVEKETSVTTRKKKKKKKEQ